MRQFLCETIHTIFAHMQLVHQKSRNKYNAGIPICIETIRFRNQSKIEFVFEVWEQNQ